VVALMQLTLATVFAAYDRVALRWDADETLPPGVTYSLWRSESAVTGFQQVAETQLLVHIDRVNLFSKNRNIQYQVRAFVNGKELRSNVADLFGPAGDDVLRFQRRERFQLAKYDGVEAFLYVKRTFGPRCPRCVVRKGVGDAGIECRRCFGTGFDGGFLPPIPVYIAHQTLDQSNADLQKEYVKEGSNAQMWTSNWTDLAAEDIIMEAAPPNTIWIVSGAQASARRRTKSRQLFSANEVTRGHVVSHLPVPLFPWPDRKDMFLVDHAKPPRDFNTIFEELLTTYVQAQADGRADEPGPGPRHAQAEGGNRNPANRVSS
jgi:hypothetical protein